MAVGVFSSKIFNPEVFGKYIETIPRTKLNELLKSGVLQLKPELAGQFPEQAGGNYASFPITGRIGGVPAKYDGVENMPISGLETYMQSAIAIGWQKGWKEEDFTKAITGKDFMVEIARQVSDYWDDYDQKTVISILSGVFEMTGTMNEPFVETHTTDLTSLAGDLAKFGATTLNTAMQRACGDNRNSFSMIIMHSLVAANLENHNLMERLKYTDKDGITRSLNLGTLNGVTVLIDDSMPNENGNYTSYVLGKGVIDYAELAVKVPFEVWRDPHTAGGYDELLTRRRRLFAPYGISFTKAAMASPSPDLSELELGVNWEVVKNSEGTKTIDIKAIPIARIITKG